MSKGNGVDPMDIIQVFGADALRFAMCYLTTETQDVRMPVEYRCPHCEGLIEQTKGNMLARTIVCNQCEKEFAHSMGGRGNDRASGAGSFAFRTASRSGGNFCNKIWNATRFILQNREEESPASRGNLEDTWAERWIKSRLGRTLGAIEEAVEQYRFSEMGQKLYQFFWNDFCDWYVELAKPRQRSDEPGRREHTLGVLTDTLAATLQMLHPVVPYITEDLWHRLYPEDAKSFSIPICPDRTPTPWTKPWKRKWSGSSSWWERFETFGASWRFRRATCAKCDSARPRWIS
jgi:valyl-tRNA synthetase